jgi:hypothetical protein
MTKKEYIEIMGFIDSLSSHFDVGKHCTCGEQNLRRVKVKLGELLKGDRKGVCIYG